MDEIQTFEWTNVTWILHLLINPCVKCIFNARYQCVKCMNYEWTNFAHLPLLSYEMLNLWWIFYAFWMVLHKNDNKNAKFDFAQIKEHGF